MPLNRADLVREAYLEKLYFYCLKKTGNKTEAEELAQEIAVEALAGLARGHEPKQFEHWLWAIARNRYAKWCARQSRNRERQLLGGDDFWSVLKDGGLSVEDAVIRDESLCALRRELSLLSSSYREITVAYYMNGERIADIAKRLGLPAGTVKRKLHESRKNLKEGMSMAREAGHRSFLAENVHFSKSGKDGWDGSPWSLLQRLIPKNILLAAYRNPMSMEELCMELGISMPYMEEEVRLLVDGTLLKQLAEDRYETDFIIVDKDMQIAAFEKLTQLNERFAPLMLELLDYAWDRVRLGDIPGCQREKEELYWTYIPLAADFVINKTSNQFGVPNNYTKRPRDGAWDMTGREEVVLPYSLLMSHDGYGHEHARFATYRLDMHRLWNRIGHLQAHEVQLVADVIKEGHKLDALSAHEHTVVRDLVNRGLLRTDDREIETAFPVFHTRQLDEWQLTLEADERGGVLLNRLVELMNEYYLFNYAVIGKGTPARLQNQLKFVAGQQLYAARMAVLRWALEHGRLRLPDDPDRSAIAMYMTLS